MVRGFSYKAIIGKLSSIILSVSSRLVLLLFSDSPAWECSVTLGNIEFHSRAFRQDDDPSSPGIK